jgi:hypothetical protein
MGIEGLRMLETDLRIAIMANQSHATAVLSRAPRYNLLIHSLFSVSALRVLVPMRSLIPALLLLYLDC